MEKIPFEVIGLTSDDEEGEEGEELEVDRDREHEAPEVAERRENEAREQEMPQERVNEKGRDDRAESPDMQAHLRGGVMRMAAMRQSAGQASRCALLAVIACDDYGIVVNLC